MRNGFLQGVLMILQKLKSPEATNWHVTVLDSVKFIQFKVWFKLGFLQKVINYFYISH